MKLREKKNRPITVAFLALALGLFVCLPVQAQDSRTKVTCVDSALQKLAARLLENKQGAIVCMVPQTGEVRCMQSGSFWGDSINRVFGRAYSPGSTFKVAQTLAQVSMKSLFTQSSYSCSKGFWYKNLHIGCHVHRSPLTLVEALAQSCNSYFCKSFISLVREHPGFETKHQTMDAWREIMLSLGLGQPLGIDLPGEASGQMPGGALLDSLHRGRWNEATIMWMGMGQGEATVTPLQLCNLAALVANRGWWITPHVAPWDSVKIAANRHEAKVDKEAWPIVWKGMRGCVTHGTAKPILKSGFDICGKTGTAENPGDDHSIFICFAPMEKPQIAVAVYIEHGGFGADMAAPMAALMVEQALTGKLSPLSRKKVSQWQEYFVFPTATDPGPENN